MANAPAILSAISLVTLVLVGWTFFFSNPSTTVELIPVNMQGSSNTAMDPRFLEQFAHQRRDMDQLSNTLANLGRNDDTFSNLLSESRKELDAMHSASEEHLAAHGALLKQIYDRVEALQKDLVQLASQQEADAEARQLQPKCVVNPSQHYEDTGYLEKECPSYGVKGVGNQVADPSGPLLKKSYMLSLAGHYDDYAVRRDFLKKKGVDLQRFEAIDGKKVFADLYDEYYDAATNTSIFTFTDKDGKVFKRGDEGYLTFGERGYLASMKGIFELSLKDPSVQTVMVLDDDAIFDCNFRETLNKVLKEPRCGDHVARDSRRGGVLLLGAAVWINGTWPERTKWTGGWNQITNDMNRATEAAGGKETMCFNADSKTMGSFGVIYHRDVFEPMINWIGNTTEPFDHIYPFLSRQGYVVRVAYPSIVIQDVRHTSSVDPSRKGQEDSTARANMHRWDLKRFCNPADGLPMA